MERIELPLADAKSKAAGPSPHPSFGEVAEGPGPLSHLPFARGAAAAAGGGGGQREQPAAQRAASDGRFGVGRPG